MRLIELRAENFKRLSAVRIKPTGAVTPITGKNGAGKTSVLDAIACALGGAGLAPEVPIRKGQSRAQVVVDLGDITVARKWTAKGSTLEVATKDGAAYKSPQAVLDKLVGELSFDPLAFAHMKPVDQANTLARVAGIDLDLHRTARQSLYADRATAAKTAKELRAQLLAVPPLPDDVPDEEISVSAMLNELAAADAAKRNRETATRDLADAVSQNAIANRRVGELRVQLREAEFAAAAAEVAEDARRQALNSLPAAPELEPIKARGRAAEETNRQVRAKKARGIKETDVARLEVLAKDIAVKIDTLDAGLALRLAEAALPIPALSIGEHGVALGGIPFAQCSGAERLRASVAVGLALNPKLKLMLIRDGSLLDDDGMRLLAEMAEAAGAQVLIERVDNGREVGVRIVDGETEAA